MAHEYAQYWDRGVRNVPDMTGARHLLEAQDIPVLAQKLGLKLPLLDVLDVGCGTGRLARHVSGKYMGVDIAQSAVDYCADAGLQSMLIDGPDDVPALGRYGMVTAISVFTHVDVSERRRYLASFAKVAPRMIVDIIPGDGSGEVALWTADPAKFEADVKAAGWTVKSIADMSWGNDDVVHRYYYAERGK